jgi:hypothetical protein
MALTKRSTKGSPLTHAEMDANFEGLADGSLITALDSSKATFAQSGSGLSSTTVSAQLQKAEFFESISALKAWSGPTNKTLAFVRGYYAAGDGGGGIYYYDTSSSATDNGGTIIRPTAAPASGRWLRQFDANQYSVEVFGAKGDGSTDDSAAIQAALDAIGSAGGAVTFQGKTYKITTGLSTSTANISLVGKGNVGQDGTLGAGSTIIEVSGAIVGFTFNSAASSTIFRGPLLRDIHFKGSATGTGGILLKRTNNWLLENVAVSGFTAGYGVKSDGTGSVNQYGTLIEPKLHNCLIGYHGLLSNGIVFIGGYLDGNSNGGSVASGTTGIMQESGDTLGLIGVRIQFYATGIDLQSGLAHEVQNSRMEGFTTGIKIASPDCSVFGGSYNNSILGSTTGTGISVIAGGTGCKLYPGSFASVSNKILIATVTDTFYVLENNIRINSGVTLLAKNTGGMRAINNLFVDSNVIVADVTASAKVLFGSAQDTNCYRVASNVFGTDDAFHALALTAIPAGGTAGAGLKLSSTTNFGVFFGSGAPTLAAAKGSLYMRSDGSTTNDRMYVNTDGSTTWTAVTTAA